jgi:4-phytase/acid phosphatase
MQAPDSFSRNLLSFTLRSFAAFAALVFTSPGLPVFAQDAGQQAAPILTVIVTRHGVREITEITDPKDLGYAWPNWEITKKEPFPKEPYLTGHGYRLMRLMGKFYRESLPGVDCSRNVFIYADKAQRTLATARAVTEGLCDSPKLPDIFHEPNLKAIDPIFDATEWLSNQQRIDISASKAAVAAAAGCPDSPDTNCDTPVKQEANVFEAFQKLLNARCPSGKCLHIDDPTIKSLIKVKGLAALDGPVGVARSYSEDVFLEFAQCRHKSEMTGQDPGKTILGPEELQTALENGMLLHVVDYDINARNTYNNKNQGKVYNPYVRGGTLLTHIIAMLDEKAGKDIFRAKIKTPIVKDARLVILSGHDTQLGALGGILEAHWAPESGIVRDDMPPGSALVFDLIRPADGEYRVRIGFVSMTRDQFRTEERRSDGIKFHPVQYRLCEQDNKSISTTDGCAARLTEFEKLGLSLLEARKVVYPDWEVSNDQAPVQEAVALLSDPSWTKKECGGP